MGEATRRKKADHNFGKITKPMKERIYIRDLIKDNQEDWEKNLLDFKKVSLNNPYFFIGDLKAEIKKNEKIISATFEVGFIWDGGSSKLSAKRMLETNISDDGITVFSEKDFDYISQQVCQKIRSWV